MKFNVGILALILIFFVGMVDAQSGEITGVKVNILDTPSWLGLLFGDDEVEFLVNVTGSGNYEIHIYDATNETHELCAIGPPALVAGLCKPTFGCQPATSGVNLLTTNWRDCSLNDFRGIAIIKLVDKNTQKVVDEEVVPLYYEDMVVYNMTHKEHTNVSDPLNYTHQLIVDENCSAVGGDFCVPQMGGRVCKVTSTAGHGRYEIISSKDHPVVRFARDLWKALGGGIESPQDICHKENSTGENDTYGIIDAEIWQVISNKTLPGDDNKTIYYLLNHQQYSSYDIKTCKDYDWEKTTFLHQAQYKVLANTFFREEEFYEDLYKTYVHRYVDFGVLNPLYMLAGPVFQLKFVLGLIATKEALDDAQAKTNQMYCFKTHLKEHLGCYALNYEWYTLTDVDSPADPRAAPLDYDYFNGTFYRSPYFDNIKKWNYDQRIVDII